MKQKLILLLSLVVCTACHKASTNEPKARENSEYQEKLMRDGWTFETLSDSELGEEYGFKPIYGLQDNYFDITMGEGYNVAIKIMDATTDKCIRYAVVSEQSTTTISQIPQGRYYLKLAYGQDWMELSADSMIIGKFTRNADPGGVGHRNNSDLDYIVCYSHYCKPLYYAFFLSVGGAEGLCLINRNSHNIICHII